MIRLAVTAHFMGAAFNVGGPVETETTIIEINNPALDRLVEMANRPNNSMALTFSLVRESDT